MTGKQKAWLKKKAHNMTVSVMVGDKGITASLLTSLKDNLKANELVKASVSHPDREVRKKLSEEIAEKTSSEIVALIGKTTILYRANKEKPVISTELGKVK